MTARPRTRRRHREPSRDAPQLQLPSCSESARGSSLPRPWLPNYASRSAKDEGAWVSLNRKRTHATKLTFYWLIFACRCRLGVELCHQALPEDGGALGGRRCQKKPHSSFRSATQRILVSVQVSGRLGRGSCSQKVRRGTENDELKTGPWPCALPGKGRESA